MRLLHMVTSPDRGEESERETVLRLLKMGIDHRAIFHDCYLRRLSGTYAQVDLVVATRVGLLVFEIKDYSGWIYGEYWQRHWTHVLAHGREKYQFYNPIMQNRGHIRAIRENLRHNPGIPIWSIIVFYGDCEFRDVTVDSDNDFVIYPEDLKRTVKKLLSSPNARFGDKHEIMRVFTQAVANGLNPDIVSSQIQTAKRAESYRPHRRHSIISLILAFLRWLFGVRDK